MRLFTLGTIFLLLSSLRSHAQCDFVSTLDILQTPGITLQANESCTDADGWTHYYNVDNNLLLLSIKKNGQDIGSIDVDLQVTSGTRSAYGDIGFNLSNADYIDNDSWIVANRYWQLTGASPVQSPIQVRFYFDETDLDDIIALKDALGIAFPLDLDKLNIYTIGAGNNLSPYETVTQPVAAEFTFYDMAPGISPDWVSGSQNGYFFGEFEVNTTDISGSVGFLFFQNNPPVAISGNVARPDDSPVPDVNVTVAGGTASSTGPDGNYVLPDINTNLNYEIIPEKDTDHAEGVSVTDLILLSRHLLGLEDLTTPYQYIAADADNDTALTPGDLIDIQQLLLGSTAVFPNNTSWRFVPDTYVFPDPMDPFTPSFPETIEVMALPDSLFGQDFTGIKTGDIGAPSSDPPPALATSFSLPEQIACEPGNEVVFPLTVKDFTNIRGFQFTLEWDPAVITFEAVNNFGLTGFSGQNTEEGMAAIGILTFAWYSPNELGETLSSDAVICELRFTASGSLNDATNLAFSSQFTEALIVYQNLSQVPPVFTDGGLTISGDSPIAADAQLEPAGCDGGPLGSIDLTVQNVVPPVSYQWSNGEVTEDIDGLAPDTYTVTVSDNSGACPKTFSFEILSGGEFEIQAIVEDMACPNQVNGSIDLGISGGAGPFSFEWSNGDFGPFLDGLFMGTYDVTVTDAAGCTQTASYEIENTNKITPVVSVVNSTNLMAANGSIVIEDILGGNPPFTYEWNTGETTNSIMDVPPGDYIVTITDAIGCNHAFGYIVRDLMVTTYEVNGNTVQTGLFPNPAVTGGTYTVTIESEMAGEVEIAVFTTSGKLLSRKPATLQSGLSLLECESPRVSGLYFVQLLWEGIPAGWIKMVVRN